MVRCGAPLAYGTPDLQRGVGIDLAGRDLGIVLLQAALEILAAWRAPAAAWWKTSVDPHQIMTSRAAPVRSLNCRMSSISISA